MGMLQAFATSTTSASVVVVWKPFCSSLLSYRQPKQQQQQQGRYQLEDQQRPAELSWPFPRHCAASCPAVPPTGGPPLWANNRPRKCAPLRLMNVRISGHCFRCVGGRRTTGQWNTEAVPGYMYSSCVSDVEECATISQKISRRFNIAALLNGPTNTELVGLSLLTYPTVKL